MVAARNPPAEGEKRTVNVVLPPGETGEVGSDVTWKSPAWDPVTIT